MLEKRTICLLPIPFSDLSSSKKRPVLVLSNNSYNFSQEDVLVMAITSNLSRQQNALPINQENLEEGMLKHDSVLRIDKIYSVSKNSIIKKLGKINEKTFSEIVDRLNIFIAS